MSSQSLKTDLAVANERGRRLQARVLQLEKRLSEILGEQTWRESGLGVPVDIDALQGAVVRLEQQIVELNRVMTDRDRDLAAARAANRELMLTLNQRQASVP